MHSDTTECMFPDMKRSVLRHEFKSYNALRYARTAGSMGACDRRFQRAQPVQLFVEVFDVDAFIADATTRVHVHR